jgi:hypothetical protein
MPDLKFRSRWPAWGLAALLVLGFAVYLPGLRGGFVFDDFPNIVDDPAYAPAMLQAHFWAAVFGGHAGPLARPLSALSFALQIRGSGLDPWALKLVNVILHLANAALIWLLSRRILGWLQTRRAAAPGDAAPLSSVEALALGVTAAWLLAPIQLTAVLYVVQREEALAAFFVLLGLLGYWHGRMLLLAGARQAWIWLYASLIVGTLLASLAKETGVMLPAYAAVLEFCVLGAKAPSARARRELGLLFGIVLGVPAVLGLAWLLPPALNGSAFAQRPFTLGQRLLTEGRVLVDYLHWIVLPPAGSLSLYHDDIAVSTGWLAPASTLACWAGLVALLGAALGLRRRLPLLSFGVLWFFAGHALLASFVPLELAYEHRNYLPSWGVFLALAGVASALPRAARGGAVRVLVVGGCAATIALYALLCTLRASVWGDSYRLAYFESTEHPQSSRAVYGFARLLLLDARPGSFGYTLGMQEMERARKLPGAGLQPLQALIFVTARQGQGVPGRWWDALQSRVASGPVDAEGVNALYSLVQCGIDRVCRYTSADVARLRGVLAAAAGHAPARADLVTLQANAAVNLGGDGVAAYALMQRAVALDPDNFAYWANLVQLQIAGGQFAQARAGLERLRELDRAGLHAAAIARLQSQLDAGRV